MWRHCRKMDSEMVKSVEEKDQGKKSSEEDQGKVQESNGVAEEGGVVAEYSGDWSPAWVDKGGKCLVDITCRHCGCLILSSGVGTLCEEEMTKRLPCSRQKKDLLAGGGELETEAFARFWRVPDVFDFENVGFTNPVDGIKYLFCADCEVGPIGFQEPVSGASFVAPPRVLQKLSTQS